MARFSAWTPDFVALTAAAWIAASAANGWIAEALAPRPGAPPPLNAMRQSAHRPLDSTSLGRAFGWATPRPTPPHPLRAHLHGTLVANQPAWSSALIADELGTHVCLQGDALGDGVIEAIVPGRVRVRVGSEELELSLAGSQDPLPLAPPRVDTASLITGARLVPAMRGGELEGFRILDIRPGSLYARAGLQNGDVIRRVGGFDVRALDALASHAGELLAARSIEVELERGGLIQRLRADLRD